MKKGGYFFITLAHLEDGYYRQYLHQPSDHNLVDPQSGIESRLYSLSTLKEEFQDFSFIEGKEWSSSSPMSGVSYLRKEVMALFQKKECFY